MARTPAAPVADQPAPTVICDDVHVVYRVMGRRRVAPSAPAPRRGLRRRTTNTASNKVHAVRGVSMIAREGDAIALIASSSPMLPHTICRSRCGPSPGCSRPSRAMCTPPGARPCWESTPP